jgi:hypothetical protein
MAHLFFKCTGFSVFSNRISWFWCHKKEQKLNFLALFFQTHATLPEKVIQDLENKKKWANRPMRRADCPY